MSVPRPFRLRVTALYVHPVKSCRGVSVDAARVRRRGLDHDRRWMLVDETGTFLSQRTIPAMARVEAAVVGDELRLAFDGAPAGIARDTFALPARLSSGPRVEVEVWRTRMEARVHEAGGEWFSRVLGRPVRFVYMPDDVERVADQKYARPTDVVSFADGFPILVTTDESLADLERRAGTSIEMSRFRPNVVVGGAAPFEEDGWVEFRVGGTRLHGVKKCARCPIPDLDPTTGQRSKGVLATLARYRKDGPKVMFGMNATTDVSDDEDAWIRVGDEVEIFQT
jgi:uncharacterized protein YcbX